MDMTMSLKDNIVCWEQENEESKLDCQERYVANEMQHFPPRNAGGIERRKSSVCICRKCPARSVSSQRRRRPRGQKVVDQLLAHERKQERLVVPDLATEWFRKQKVFLDTVTPKERRELRYQMQLDEPSSISLTCDCRRCACHEPQPLQHSVQYLDYCQELRRRRLLIQRQRHQLRQGEAICKCAEPSKWPPKALLITKPSMRKEKKCVKKKDTDTEASEKTKKQPSEQELLPEPQKQPTNNNITICNPHVAGCLPDTLTEKNRFSAGSASKKPKTSVSQMYQERRCNCLRPQRRNSCACIFQADGQPMAEECLAAMRRSESPPLRLRKKYDLREAPQRRLDPACFRRISPEFYSLLKSYEDGMTERYPLYGLPLRYWAKAAPTCPCEQLPECACEPCLGDQSLATEVPERPPKPKPKDESVEDEVECESSVLAIEECNACCANKGECQRNDCHEPCATDVCTRDMCIKYECKVTCIPDEPVDQQQQQQPNEEDNNEKVEPGEEIPCTKETCKKRRGMAQSSAAELSAPNLNQPRVSYKLDNEHRTVADPMTLVDTKLINLIEAKSTGLVKSNSLGVVRVNTVGMAKSKSMITVDSNSVNMVESSPLAKSASNSVALAKSKPLSMNDLSLLVESSVANSLPKQRTRKRKGWFFLTSSANMQFPSASSQEGEPERKNKRKGVLGSVAGLCKRAIQPGRYLLYSLSTISRQPPSYGSGSLNKNKSKSLRGSSFFSRQPKYGNWQQRQETNASSSSQCNASQTTNSLSVVQKKCFYLKRKPAKGQVGHIGIKPMPAGSGKLQVLSGAMAQFPQIHQLMITGVTAAPPKPMLYLPIETSSTDSQVTAQTINPSAAICSNLKALKGDSISCQQISSICSIPDTRLTSLTEPTASRETVINLESTGTICPEAKADVKPSTSNAASRSYTKVSDYTQLMRLVARKRIKPRQHKRCTVTFADRNRTNVRQCPNLMQNQRTRCKSQQLVGTRNRSPSPGPRYRRTINNRILPAQGTNSGFTGRAYPRATYSNSNRSNQRMVLTSSYDVELPAQKSDWFSPYSDESASDFSRATTVFDGTDSFKSCESKQSTWEDRDRSQDSEYSSDQSLQSHNHPITAAPHNAPQTWKTLVNPTSDNTNNARHTTNYNEPYISAPSSSTSSTPTSSSTIQSRRRTEDNAGNRCNRLNPHRAAHLVGQYNARTAHGIGMQLTRFGNRTQQHADEDDDADADGYRQKMGRGYHTAESERKREVPTVSRRQSVDSFVSGDRTVTTLDPDTSLDTVERNEERVATVTRYTNQMSTIIRKESGIVSQRRKSEKPGLNLLFSSKPPINARLLKLRDATIRLPKLKIKTPHSKAQCSLRTRRPPPRPVTRLMRLDQVQFADGQQWEQINKMMNKDPKVANMVSTFYQPNRPIPSYDSSTQQLHTPEPPMDGSNLGYDSDNDDDNTDMDTQPSPHGRNVTSCRSRSGCDVQFPDDRNCQKVPSKSKQMQPTVNPKNPTTSKLIGRSAVLPSVRTYIHTSGRKRNFKVYATPCSSSCCLSGESGTQSQRSETETDLSWQKSEPETSSDVEPTQQQSANVSKFAKKRELLPVERYQRRAQVVRQTIATNSETSAYRGGKTTIKQEYGRARTTRPASKDSIYESSNKTQQLSAMTNERNSYGTSARLAALSESLGYPAANRFRSRSSLISYAIAPPITTIKRANYKQVTKPNSILKSSTKPLNKILKQATDGRRVNFVAQRLSDSSMDTMAGKHNTKPDTVYPPKEPPPAPYIVPSCSRRPTVVPRHMMDKCDLERGQPHCFNFCQQELPHKTKMATRSEKENLPSIFAIPTTATLNEFSPNLTRYTHNSSSNHDRLTVHATTAAEHELEESRLPMNSQLLSKRSDFPNTKRRINDRIMPPGVSIVSDLEFKTHLTPTRSIEPNETRERGGSTTTDVPLILATVLDQLRKRRAANRCASKGYSTSRMPCRATITDCLPCGRMRYPCSQDVRLGNIVPMEDNYHPRRSCYLRRLPEEPVVIAPTHTGLREQQLRQSCLPVLFYGRKIVSAIQASFSFLVGLIVCKSTCSKSFVYASHFLMEAYGWFGTAYFMYDIWSMYKVHTQKIADKLHLLRLSNSQPFTNGHARSYYDKAAGGDRSIGNNNGSTPGTPHEICDYDGACVQIPKDGRWDFLKYVLTHPVMMIHHVFIGTFGLLVVTYIRGGGHCIYSYMFMMEFSTPFVSLRSILSTMGLKDSRVYILNGLLMLATFFVCRVCMWPYVMWRYSLAIDAASMWAAMCGLPRGCLVSIAILFLPQLYWFYLMVMGALKVFLPKRRKLPAAALGNQLQANVPLTATPLATPIATINGKN